jgi:hypothetical protein
MADLRILLFCEAEVFQLEPVSISEMLKFHCDELKVENYRSMKKKKKHYKNNRFLKKFQKDYDL